MRTFPFLRRPVKPVLYAILLALVTTAALIFAWQYHLDGIILDHAIDTYAYVGTVVRSDGQIMDGDGKADRDDRDLAALTGDPTPALGGPAFLEELPEGLVRWLYDCGDITRIDSRRTQAAQVGEYTRVHLDERAQTVIVGDSMMSASYVTPYHFLEGTVEFIDCWSDPEDELQHDEYRLRVDRMWSDPAFPNDTIMVSYHRCKEEPQLQIGQRVFLIGMQSQTESGMVINSTTYVWTPAANELTLGTTSLPMQDSVLQIPEGVDSESYIQDFLASTGLDEYLHKQLSSQSGVSVRRSLDMKMIPLFAQGKARTYEGRVLNPTDVGKKVCVISNGLSQRNRLSVGDTIRLSLADGCYTIHGLELMEHAEGWETHEQGPEDASLTYGDYEEYEIVGIYTQAARRTKNALYFPYTTIFLPAEEGNGADVAKPYTFSFKVAGPDYQDFLADFQPVLDEYGYTLIVEDTGWDDVKESFYTMQTRRQLMLICAAAAFAAAVAVFAILLSAHCSYEYGLRRLLGASKREALGIYGAVFAFTAIPGGAAAVCGAWGMAVHLMREALASDKTVPLPTDAQCAGTLAAWAALELLAALVLLMLLAWRAERRGLLKLTRR